MQRRRWPPAGGVVESSDLKCSASAGSVLHRNHRIHLWWPALAHSACQEGSAHVRKASHTHRLQLRRVVPYTPLMESVACSIMAHHYRSVQCHLSTLSGLIDLTEAAEPDDAVGSHGRAWPPAVKPGLAESLRGVRWSDPSRPAAGKRVTRRGRMPSFPTLCIMASTRQKMTIVGSERGFPRTCMRSRCWAQLIRVAP